MRVTTRLSRMVSLPLLLLALLTSAALAGEKTTTYYTLHYDSWSEVADALTPYLDAAFTTSKNVLGYDNSGFGKIDIYFYSDPGSATLGYTTAGQNSFHLNLTHGTSLRDSYLSEYGQTIAHETAHVFFFHQTKLNEKYAWSSDGAATYTWLTEALSYYVGGVAYPYGSQYSKATLASTFKYYSRNGAERASWLDTGRDYKNGSASALELVQLETIGYFISETYSWSGIASLLSTLAANGNYESAFKTIFGKESGQSGTSSGADVNTLYSDYIHFYLGHY